MAKRIKTTVYINFESYSVNSYNKLKKSTKVSAN